MAITFDQFLNKDQLSDCSITVKDAHFKGHRVILAASSKYFRTHFTTELEATRDVFIPDVHGDIMEILLQYMYTGTCNLTDDNVFNVYITANYLDISRVLEYCVDYLIERLNLSTCINIYLFSKLYNAEKLKQNSYMYLLRNITKIIEDYPHEFLELELKDLVEILSSDYLNVSSEEKTWEAILLWVQYKSEERQVLLPSLLKTIRLGLLSPEYFLTRIRNHPAIAENEECQPIISETLKFLFDFDILDVHSLGRFRMPNDIVFAMGGWTVGNPTNAIETYDTRADHWATMKEVDPMGPRAYHGTIVIDHEIYVIGGYNGFDYFNGCRSFNIVNRSWRDIAPMHKSRCYVSVTFCDGYIYAMGGYNGQRRQNTAERYDVSNNQWTMIANMHSPRSDASATTLNGKIYIVGGFNGHACLSSAEMYDPERNKWEQIAPMNSRRSGVSCTAFQDNIYVLGGFNGRNRLSSGEKYDPQTRLWMDIPNMIHCRSNFGIVAVDDFILVIGGYDGDTTTSHVECFCPSTRQWWVVDSLNIARSALSACVATNFPNIESFSYQMEQETPSESHVAESAAV